MNPIKIVTRVKQQLAQTQRRMGEGVLALGEMLAQGLQVLVPGMGAGISSSSRTSGYGKLCQRSLVSG
jgi:hypothetical protein